MFRIPHLYKSSNMIPQKKTSIVVRISVALACIVMLGMTTMLISYWISEKAENDSLAINVAGSLRMQSYKIGLMSIEGNSQELRFARNKIDSIWKHPVFDRIRREKPHISELYDEAFLNWSNKVVPAMQNVKSNGELQSILDQQIELLDQLVTAIQVDAEYKVRSFRLVQIIALFTTLFVSVLVMYALKVKVEQPLTTLTNAAKRISQGDFGYRIRPMEANELGVLAETLNSMNAAIGYMYENLEKQVDEKTDELKKSNITLQFLYDTARFIIEHNPEGINFDEIISRLSSVTGVNDIELCLMTNAGNSPYLQIKPASEITQELCAAKNCEKCIASRGIVEKSSSATTYRFQLNREQRHFGLIVCNLPPADTLSTWQEQLIQSVTDQLAVGLSLKSEEDQSRRVAVLQERNAIARELHDSLAQALSYLKIQVTRLNLAINKEDKNTMEDVADELKQGLNNAYRQLRELLTTFRLKVDGGGLKNALDATVQQLSEQSSIEISLDFNLFNVPLTPNEEIHLLQIIREASQNAIHHSKGTKLNIHLKQLVDKKISLTIDDDGIGMPDSPEKLNHYGLAIMKERGKHLGGILDIHNNHGGGTRIDFTFLPEFIIQRNKNNIAVTDITETKEL
ncbi:histidine kinase [Cellvibrio sp.]|uniref:histidine kinase n=1 Tax=Cellvibrio sp. TaxID=1965322 RepID=UPI00396486BA